MMPTMNGPITQGGCEKSSSSKDPPKLGLGETQANSSVSQANSNVSFPATHINEGGGNLAKKKSGVSSK